MLKLSAAITHWTPSGESNASDPLALLQAGWREIVGEKVAVNCAPTRIVGGTLVVVTRSSAWSHQLTFLSEQVLGAVMARLPNAGVERLRFRVGALPKRGGRGTSPRRSAATGSAEMLPPSANAADALARFAKHVEATRRAKRRAGWNECKRCAALVGPSRAEFCAACLEARRQERELATARLLFEAPWLGFAGTAELVDGLCGSEYESIRSLLLRRWWGMLERTRAAGRLSRDGRERLIASSYVVLRSKLPPEGIMPATVRSVLGDELHDLLYGDERKA
jgi:hypothetical protein